MLGYHRQARILGATGLRVNEIVWTRAPDLGPVSGPPPDWSRGRLRASLQISARKHLSL